MEIIRNITTKNFRSLVGKVNKYIVVHYVGALGNAKQNGIYFQDFRNASAHYFVDEKDIVQVVEDYNEAWHCGTKGAYKHKDCRNHNSIGIEICCYKDGDNYKMLPQAIENAKFLVQTLMYKYGIPKDNVLRHFDVTGKNCPLEWAYDICSEWEMFKKI